jgi:polyphosphate:AMP phosphotransferase
VLEAAETGSRITKDEFDDAVPKLRLDLVNAQYDLQKADFSVVIVIGGNDRLGCEHLVNRLHEWMDARYMGTHVLEKFTEEERQRPRFWRYWLALPPCGRIGVYYGAWPLVAVAERLRGDIDEAGFVKRLEHISHFEEELVHDGTLVVKFWLHVPKDELERRLHVAETDPDAAWRAEPVDWEIYAFFDKVKPVVEHMLSKTSTGFAPWQIIESSDARYCHLTVGRTIRKALKRRLKETPGPQSMTAIPATGADALKRVDLSAELPKKEYKDELEKLQRRVAELQQDAFEAGRSTVLVFEGWDAAGKGGVIRRITAPLPARSYHIMPIAAPTDEERARHYLWRFWRHLPRAGRIMIFDRSWYGRVLVERVEGFAREDEWRRAYEEINDFEDQLFEHGMLVRKFWLHIDRDEQMRRFKARKKTAFKKYKLTEEDYRNRDKWGDYVEAVNEMVARTSTAHAPWRLVAANDKRHARIEVLRTVCDGLEGMLDGSG